MDDSSVLERKGRGRRNDALRTRRTPPFRRWITEIRADARKCYSAVSTATSREAKAQAFKEHFRDLGERLSFYQWQLFRHVTPRVARDVLPEDQRQLLRTELKAIWGRRISPKLRSWIYEAADDAKPGGWCAPEWLRQILHDPLRDREHRSAENVFPSSPDGLMSAAETEELLCQLEFELEYRLLLDSDRIIREFILSAESPGQRDSPSTERSGFQAEVGANPQSEGSTTKQQQRKWPIVLRRERNRRERIMCEIISKGLKGLDYCKELDAQGVRLPKARDARANSYRTYVQTYHEKRWRDRIFQEKSRLTRKYELKVLPDDST